MILKKIKKTLIVVTLLSIILNSDSMSVLAKNDNGDMKISYGISRATVLIEQEYSSCPKIYLEEKNNNFCVDFLSSEMNIYIDEVSKSYSLDSNLIKAIIWVESNGIETAENKWCYGLMQLNKSYSDTFCEEADIDNIYDPKNNIKGGCWFFSTLVEKFGGNTDYALMAYNLGESSAREYIKNMIFETEYSKKVNFIYNSILKNNGVVKDGTI